MGANAFTDKGFQGFYTILFHTYAPLFLLIGRMEQLTSEDSQIYHSNYLMPIFVILKRAGWGKFTFCYKKGTACLRRALKFVFLLEFRDNSAANFAGLPCKPALKTGKHNSAAQDSTAPLPCRYQQEKICERSWKAPNPQAKILSG